MSTLYILYTNDEHNHGALSIDSIFYTYESMDVYMRQVLNKCLDEYNYRDEKYRFLKTSPMNNYILRKYTIDEHGKLTYVNSITDYISLFKQSCVKSMCEQPPDLEKTYAHKYQQTI